MKITYLATQYFFWVPNKYFSPLSCKSVQNIRICLSYPNQILLNTRFFLLEHLNFSSGWMCLFFQPFSASNVLIDVLNRNSNEKSKQHHYTSKIESIDLFTKLKTIFSFLRNSSLFCFITEFVNISFLFSSFLISVGTCSSDVQIFGRISAWMFL